MSTSASDRDHLIAASLSLVAIAGLHLDGWAHANRPGLETFFTPWHAVLYSGFVLSAAWLILLGVRLGGRSAGAVAWWRALPKAYKSGIVGVAIFAAGGAGDMLWHTLFGVETGVDALLSPTHLVLLVGGMLVFSAPAVAAARDFTGRWPGVAAIALSTASIAGAGAFFLSYLEVFQWPRASQLYVPNGANEGSAVLGFGGYLANTAAIVVAILLLRRFLARPPLGVLTAVTAVVAIGGAAFTEFAYPEPIVGAILGAVVADVALAVLPWPWDRWLVLGALAPLAIWSGQLIGVEVGVGIGWTVELWAGVVALCSLAGLSLALLTRPRDVSAARRDEPATTEATLVG
ncbi:hypothetical protein AB0M47_14170 [Hamadaea sp. NPDC051192]|uniref:hypothetical protein n=1 Tax=Hamadaea sp. NPDC051192 TaxID=3154940 RepID=UPI00342D528E